MGVASLKLADCMNERSREYYRQDTAKEYAYITADEFSDKQVIEKEKEILK